MVYDDGSGQTHCLDSLSAALLDELEAGPSAEQSLINQVAIVTGRSSIEVQQAVVTALEQLAAVGLVDHWA